MFVHYLRAPETWNVIVSTTAASSKAEETKKQAGEEANMADQSKAQQTNVHVLSVHVTSPGADSYVGQYRRIQYSRTYPCAAHGINATAGAS